MRHWLLLSGILFACSGPPGPAGPQGDPGTPGLPGKDSSESKLVEHFQCSARIDALKIKVDYEVFVWSTDFLFVSAQVSDMYFSSSSSTFYNVGETGWMVGEAPRIVFDVEPQDNGGYFVISLERQSVSFQALYHDGDIASGETIYKFKPTACLHSIYN